MSKRHICIDARMIHHSGIGTYLRMLLPEILPNYKVTLLGDPVMLKSYAGLAEIVEFLSPIYSVEEQCQYPRIIPVCDLYWSPHYNAPLMSIKASKKVTTIHDAFHLAFISQLSFKQKLYAKIVMNMVALRSDSIITVSHFSKDEIVQRTIAKADKVTVIYNGVKQLPDRLGFDDMARKYNLPQNYLLFVGNVKPHKNLRTLALAYLALPADIRSEYKLVVVGKKDGFITGEHSLFELINANPALKDNVVFTGFVEDGDMDMIYNKAKLFVFPSLYEGFGLPPLEAMLNNCPVAVSTQAALREVCGDAALYFDPLDVDDMASAITRLLKDLDARQELVKKGTERIKIFNWAKSALQHIQLFDQLL